MDLKFENRTTFPDGSVGKLILCLLEDGKTIALYGKMVSDICANGATQKDFDISYPLGKITELVGEHKDIPHEGTILGGTKAIFTEGNLYCESFSTKFGPMHPEATQLCVGEDITVKSKWSQFGWGGSIYPNRPASIEEYIQQK